ncbi:MAG: phenylalanine--tRNA ligase subunit beta [Candidatus Westeberhardia cardiocondylae]|nr:phenylalanine--tRNA ligase subunit beta [Candidatus Westeberhardia cardiocondylae]
MKFSEYWLCKWFKIKNVDSNFLLENFSSAGLEIVNVEKVSNYFSKIIIGKIIKCFKHPSIKDIFITKVEVGLSNLLSILCSSINCRVNLKVAVAMVGSMLPNGKKIKNVKFDNQISEGLLCSFFMLGMSLYDSKNIIELPEDAPIGCDVYYYLKLNDNIINVNISSNRSDCFSIFGIARDLSIVSGLKLKQPKIRKVFPVVNDSILVSIEVPKYCPCYIGRIIKNINVNVVTPLWIKEKLRRSGFYSVDIITDISYYIFLEFGYPIFILDYQKIEQCVTVRLSKLHEIFFLSKFNKINLFPGTLVISDKKKILSIAGITYSDLLKVNTETKDIFLECSYFNSELIYNASNKYNIHTEFSKQYERGIDPYFSSYVIERITFLLISICGGKPGPIIEKIFKNFFPNSNKIILRKYKINQLVGKFISNNKIENILFRIGCKTTNIKIGWKVFVPVWRFDLLIEEDLIEEILRIYGYSNIPDISICPSVDPPVAQQDVSLHRTKILLSDRGYNEIITYSFVNPKIQELIHPGNEVLHISNPISKDMSVMRISLLTGLVNSVLYNQNRQQNRIRFFESGFCFIPDKNSYLGIRQDFMLSGIVSGSRFNEHWGIEYKETDFYDVKGDLESIFNLHYILQDVVFKKLVHKYHYIFHPNESSEIYFNDIFIGVIGVIHPILKKKLDFNNNIIIFELFYEKILKYNIPIFNEFTKFPVNKRDISLIVKNEVNAGDIISVCKKILFNNFVDIDVFDVYKDEHIKHGYKSLSIRIFFNSHSKTFKEKEISYMIELCLMELKNKFDIFLRYKN